jgi:hypothetical protein
MKKTRQVRHLQAYKDRAAGAIDKYGRRLAHYGIMRRAFDVAFFAVFLGLVTALLVVTFINVGLDAECTDRANPAERYACATVFLPLVLGAALQLLYVTFRYPDESAYEESGSTPKSSRFKATQSEFWSSAVTGSSRS